MNRTRKPSQGPGSPISAKRRWSRSSMGSVSTGSAAASFFHGAAAGSVNLTKSPMHAVQGSAYFTTNNTSVQNVFQPNTQAQGGQDSGVLRFFPPDIFTSFHRHIQEGVTPGTGHEFQQEAKLQRWAKTSDNRLLWCKGDPGTGKTHLASCIIESELEKASKRRSMAVIYAYLQFSGQHTTWDVVVGLIRQLVDSPKLSTAAAHAVNEVFKPHEGIGTRPTVPELVKLLKALLKEYDDRSITLDGLDELETPCQVELLDIVTSLDARILIFSRHIHHLKDSGLRPQTMAKADFLEVKASPSDLDLFISEEIRKTRALWHLLQEHGMEEEVINKIKEKAAGMFLHAFLHVRALKACFTKHAVLREIDRFPLGIRDLYADMVGRIEREPEKYLVDLAKRALVWLLNAQGPLTIDDLREAITVYPENGRSFDPTHRVSRELILSLCHGLIVVESQTQHARLVHGTAYENLPAFLGPLYPHPHDMMASVCLARLVNCGFQRSTIKTIGDARKAFARYPLLRYADRNIVQHYKKSNSLNTRLKDRVDAFIRNADGYPFFKLYLEHPTAFNDQIQIPPLSPLHLAALFDLPDLITELVCEDNDVNLKQEGEYWTPLSVASYVGHARVVDAILSLPKARTDLSDISLQEAFLLACFNGHVDIAKSFLQISSDQGASSTVPPPLVDANCHTPDGVSPLMGAALGGHIDMVELLLSTRKIDVNLVDITGRTALCFAAAGGHNGVVELLLAERGIEVNRADDDGWTALLYAANKGHTSTVQRLINFPGTNTHWVNNKGLSARRLAASVGHHDIARMLKEAGGSQSSGDKILSRGKKFVKDFAQRLVSKD